MAAEQLLSFDLPFNKSEKDDDSQQDMQVEAPPSLPSIAPTKRRTLSRVQQQLLAESLKLPGSIEVYGNGSMHVKNYKGNSLVHLSASGAPYEIIFPTATKQRYLIIKNRLDEEVYKMG